VRIGSGVYGLASRYPGLKVSNRPNNDQQEGADEQCAIFTAFGMFWRREAIEWLSNPKLLGRQRIGRTSFSDVVDFNRQCGIYLLYDGREIVYVGQVTSQRLGKRLYEHTIDRLSTRWDRFPWFGLTPMSSSGELGGLPRSYDHSKLVLAFEAILIEALEPRQNRRGGDHLVDIEYIQKVYPTVNT